MFLKLKRIYFNAFIVSLGDFRNIRKIRKPSLRTCGFFTRRLRLVGQRKPLTHNEDALRAQASTLSVNFHVYALSLEEWASERSWTFLSYFFYTFLMFLKFLKLAPQALIYLRPGFRNVSSPNFRNPFLIPKVTPRPWTLISKSGAELVSPTLPPATLGTLFFFYIPNVPRIS